MCEQRPFRRTAAGRVLITIVVGMLTWLLAPGLADVHGTLLVSTAVLASALAFALLG